jgi:septum formation protein
VSIIAADTIVVLDDLILGKPADAADAARMLRLLSGRRHVVITGISILHRIGDTIRMHGDAVRTFVSFRHVGEQEIHHYVASGEPMDKAGAYAIQGGAGGMVDHIDGSYSNVVGLPMEAVSRLLAGTGETDQNTVPSEK